MIWEKDNGKKNERCHFFFFDNYIWLNEVCAFLIGFTFSVEGGDFLSLDHVLFFFFFLQHNFL